MEYDILVDVSASNAVLSTCACLVCVNQEQCTLILCSPRHIPFEQFLAVCVVPFSLVEASTFKPSIC